MLSELLTQIIRTTLVGGPAHGRTHDRHRGSNIIHTRTLVPSMLFSSGQFEFDTVQDHDYHVRTIAVSLGCVVQLGISESLLKDDGQLMVSVNEVLNMMTDAILNPLQEDYD